MRVTKSEQAAAGVIHAIHGRGLGADDPGQRGLRSRPKRDALTAGEGRRGVQEDNRSIKGSRCGSVGFIGVVFRSRKRVEGGGCEAGPQAFQTVAVPSRHRVWRFLEQGTDFFEGVVMPDLEHDDLALVWGKFLQTRHGSGFSGLFPGSGFEPGMGLPFAKASPPEASPVVKGAIPDRPDEVVRRFGRQFLQSKQGDEDLLDDVLRLRVIKPEGASVENQLGSLGLVQGFAAFGSILDVGASHRSNAWTLLVGNLYEQSQDFIKSPGNVLRPGVFTDHAIDFAPV